MATKSKTAIFVGITVKVTLSLTLSFQRVSLIEYAWQIWSLCLTIQKLMFLMARTAIESQSETGIKTICPRMSFRGQVKATTFGSNGPLSSLDHPVPGHHSVLKPFSSNDFKLNRRDASEVSLLWQIEKLGKHETLVSINQSLLIIHYWSVYLSLGCWVVRRTLSQDIPEAVQGYHNYSNVRVPGPGGRYIIHDSRGTHLFRT